MVELKIRLVPKLTQHVQNYSCNVDDTLVYVKSGSIVYVLSTFKKYHPNIKVTCEKEVDNTLLILDVFTVCYYHVTLGFLE